MKRPQIAVIDDYQELARGLADWSAVDARADVTVFTRPWRDEEEIANKLAPFEVVVLLRERTAFPARLIERLPNLRMVAMTGNRTSTLDLAACKARGIVVVHTDSNPPVAPAELAFALILACARSLPLGHANVVAGRWQQGIPMGMPLDGKRLGVVGLGKLGARLAGYARAFNMDVVAWSANLTDEKAAAHGVRRVGKLELFETSDVISIHYGLSDRSRGIVGAAELQAMKAGAILVNTSRGPLVDEAALIDVLRSGRIGAGLDVYDIEPLPAGHPFTTMRNVVLTPHLGYVVEETMRRFYTQSVENILAYLDGAPIRVVTT
jgi:phosphoglycerate dehydrogenase-like enzyme